MADHYVPVPGGTNNNNYANVELIVNIAIRSQVQVNDYLLNVCKTCCTINIFCFIRLFGLVGDMPLRTLNFQNCWIKIKLLSLDHLKKPCLLLETKLLLVLLHRQQKFQHCPGLVQV